jgi:hypothetical protein
MSIRPSMVTYDFKKTTAEMQKTASLVSSNMPQGQAHFLFLFSCTKKLELTGW